MFRSLLCRSALALKRSDAFINGQSSSSSSPAKYFLFKLQNPNVVTIDSRVTTSIFNSFCTTASNGNLIVSDSDSSFVVSYLINSCGLSQDEAITASKKLNFNLNTKSNPDSVLTLLKSYGFTQPHISKLINKDPSILSSEPIKTLKPRFDFFNSKGLNETALANVISNDPAILKYSLNDRIIPSFNIIKSIVKSDERAIKVIKRSSWSLSADGVNNMMANVRLLLDEGVPESNICTYVFRGPREFVVDTGRFKEIVEKVKQMGFNRQQSTFLIAVLGLASMTEASWRRKMDVYKSWGWSEHQIESAYRRYPNCMLVSETKMTEIMEFLVKEMGYDSLSIAQSPRIITCSLEGRIIPRCSVSRVLVSRGLIKENISLDAISKMVDEYFLMMFVKKFEREIPQLMKVFEGLLDYRELPQN